MIHIFAVTAPLGDLDGGAVCATLQAATDALIHAHPALREASLRSSEGVLTMTLRVSGKDRWMTQRHARKIATSMLRRVRIPAESATLDLVRTPANTRSLTREQGRSVGNVGSKSACADPS